MRKITKYVKLMLFFNWNKYWKRRADFFASKKNSVKYFYLLLWVKLQNKKQNADIGLEYDMGDPFSSPPVYNPHGLNGIIIAAGAKIGKDCTVSQQVTIGRSKGGAPVIGDHVYIGPGAKVFGNIKIGNNVRIGANCPVFFDVPDNATVVLPKPRVLIKEEGYEYYT